MKPMSEIWPLLIHSYINSNEFSGNNGLTISHLHIAYNLSSVIDFSVLPTAATGLTNALPTKMHWVTAPLAIDVTFAVMDRLLL